MWVTLCLSNVYVNVSCYYWSEFLYMHLCIIDCKNGCTSTFPYIQTFSNNFCFISIQTFISLFMIYFIYNWNIILSFWLYYYWVLFSYDFENPYFYELLVHLNWVGSYTLFLVSKLNDIHHFFSVSTVLFSL